MQILGDGTNLLMIVLGFGLLIAVHELGHFVAARWAGIRVDAFAIGMGPAVLAYRRGIGWKAGSTAGAVQARFGAAPESVPLQTLRDAGVGETEYGLRLLPLGGFVRMKGQEDLTPTEEGGDPDAYGSCVVWKRMIVVSAGVAANLVLAVLLYVAAFMVGVRFESPTVGEIRPGSAASKAVDLDGGPSGLRPGDTIERVSGEPVRTFADVQIAAAMSRAGTPLVLQVRRPGREQPVRFEATPTDEPGSRLLSIGFTPAREGRILADADALALLKPILDATGISAAGVGPGSELVAVDGQPATTVGALQAACAPGKPVETTWRNADGSTCSVSVRPVAQLPRMVPADGGQPEGGLLGLVPLTRIDGCQPGSPNVATLRAGDVVLSLDGVRGPGIAAFRDLVMARAGREATLELLRDGQVVKVRVRVDSTGRLGVLVVPALEQSTMAAPIDRERRGDETVATPAATLELGPLARFVSVDGSPVNDWTSLISALTAAADRGSTSVRMGVQPAGQPAVREIAVPLSATDIASIRSVAWVSPLPMEAFDPLMTTLTADGNPLTAAAMGFRETGKLAVMTWLTIDRLVRGSVPVDQLRGPVGIVHVGTRVADRGFMYLVFFLAMISVNLAVLNFLPLPIVDGGLFLFLVYEALRGRPPSVRFQNAATMAGLLLIGSLFVVTFYNDVMRLVSGG